VAKQLPPLSDLNHCPALADWPERYTAFCQATAGPVPTAEMSMQRLERHNADIKAGRARHEERDDDGHELGRLEYLRGPGGQHDRATIWKRGTGTIGGEGGLKQ
jgi:hypothetical protein